MRQVKRFHKISTIAKIQSHFIQCLKWNIYRIVIVNVLTHMLRLINLLGRLVVGRIFSQVSTHQGPILYNDKLTLNKRNQRQVPLYV